jgi:hypothetical protein
MVRETFRLDGKIYPRTYAHSDGLMASLFLLAKKYTYRTYFPT